LNDLFESTESYKKIIIKLGINSLYDYSNVALLVYPAKNQGTHGSGTSPIPSTSITTQGTTDIDEPLIIGNNYVSLKKILKEIDGTTNRVFTYLLIIPDNGTGTYENQLVFNLKAVTVVNKDGVTTLTEQNLGASNPSPPADPGQ